MTQHIHMIIIPLANGWCVAKEIGTKDQIVFYLELDRSVQASH